MLRVMKMLSLYEARISMSDSAIYHSARRVVDNVIVARSGAYQTAAQIANRQIHNHVDQSRGQQR